MEVPVPTDSKQLHAWVALSALCIPNAPLMHYNPADGWYVWIPSLYKYGVRFSDLVHPN